MKNVGDRLNDAIVKALSSKLEKYINASCDKTTCIQIYCEVFDTLREIFEKSNSPLSNESINFVSQLYYDGITINHNQELDPNIFSQRAFLRNIPTNELALLACMFNGTDIANEFIAEIKKRS